MLLRRGHQSRRTSCGQPRAGPVGAKQQLGGCPGAGTTPSALTDTHKHTLVQPHTHTHAHNPLPGTKGHCVIEVVSELRGQDGRDTLTHSTDSTDLITKFFLT